MQRLHEIVDPDRVQALNNMIFRMEVIREGAQLRPHPWTMVGGHPAMARELAEGSGELTDKDLLKICQKLCLGREMGESVLVGNADRFYSTLSGWLRAGASVVEVDLGAEEAQRGPLTPQQVAASTKALCAHPGVHVITGFDERQWLRHLVHSPVHDSPSVASSLRQVLSRLSRIHVFIESTAQGLRFMVCAFDLIDMDWQVPLSTLSLCTDDWAERQAQGLKARPYQHPNPWFLSLIPEGAPPEESAFWTMVAFGVFTPLLSVATMALAATVSAHRLVAAPASRSPSRHERRARAQVGPSTRKVWLNLDGASAYIRSFAPAPPPPSPAPHPTGAGEGEALLAPSALRSAHVVREHVARYWVLSPGQDEPRISQQVGRDGRTLYCVERPRRAHARGQGEPKIGRVQRLGLAGSTQSNTLIQEVE